jgi:hypothetical protein
MCSGAGHITGVRFVSDKYVLIFQAYSESNTDYAQDKSV